MENSDEPVVKGIVGGQEEADSEEWRDVRVIVLSSCQGVAS